jgi:translation initiation factor 1|tara:strand:+ start:327 stop:635 length:309 start_codon:yes stop_codon:yes gene_type:complete
VADICKVCGLPEDLCVCEAIAKETQKITVRTVTRRYGKKITIIEGIEGKHIDTKQLAKKLKSYLACGGTLKKDSIELQGAQARKAKVALIKFGFPPESVVLT